MAATQDKINQIWGEINREDAEEIEMDSLNLGEDGEQTIPKTVAAADQVDTVVSQHNYLILNFHLLIIWDIQVMFSIIKQFINIAL